MATAWLAVRRAAHLPTAYRPRTCDIGSIRQPGWLEEPRGFATPSRGGCAVSWIAAHGKRPGARITAGISYSARKAVACLPGGERADVAAAHHFAPSLLAKWLVGTRHDRSNDLSFLAFIRPKRS